MIIKNATFYHENCNFQIGDIYIQKDRIANKALLQEEQVLDAKGLYAIPGLIDLHIHGSNGYDFCDASQKAFDEIASYQARNGITTLCPTTMTLAEEDLIKICKELSSYQELESGANLCGLYMEGPFIAASKKGAQNGSYLSAPDVSMFRRLQECANHKIKLVTIAPEIEGALEFIEELKDEIVISIAHTEANYQQTMKALQKGVKHITHLYNAMPTLHHRDPGVIGAAMDWKECNVEMICDGIHLHPSIIRASLRMFEDDRIIIISDSMMATGLADGVYSLGKQEVKVKGNTARIAANGSIAGSVTNLMDCVRYLVRDVKVPLNKAIQYATVNPAKALGIYHQYGSITPNKVANIVLLDQDLNLVQVILRGKLL